MQKVHYKTDGTAQACPFCFTGTCKKHPLQDHGKRAEALRNQGTRNQEILKKLYANLQPNLRVIGDISCDIEGSIECTLN